MVGLRPQRGSRLYIRVSAEEMADIVRMAWEDGREVSDYCRRVILGDKVMERRVGPPVVAATVGRSPAGMVKSPQGGKLTDEQIMRNCKIGLAAGERGMGWEESLANVYKRHPEWAEDDEEVE